MASYTGRMAPPGMPKTSLTPRSSNARTSACAPVIFSPADFVSLPALFVLSVPFGTPLNACNGVGLAMLSSQMACMRAPPVQCPQAMKTLKLERSSRADVASACGARCFCACSQGLQLIAWRHAMRCRQACRRFPNVLCNARRLYGARCALRITPTVAAPCATFVYLAYARIVLCPASGWASY